jgi:hypothetical protein
MLAMCVGRNFTEIQKAHVWSKVQVITSIWICHYVMEWTYGVAIESFAALLCQKLAERPSQDNRTSHQSRHGEHQKSLWKRWPMATLCSKHENAPSKGQIRRGQHPKRQKTIMHGTNSGILRALFCVPALPGGIYRPKFLKLNLTMTARHYPGQ